MERTKLYIYDPFSRDTAWITDEIIEDYAGACIRGPIAAEMCIAKWSQSHALKINQFREIVANHPDLMLLQEELIEEFGLEHFVGKPKPKEYHIRQLELAIESCHDLDIRAKLYKELREYQGWTAKPIEKSAAVASIVLNHVSANMLDTSNPAEVDRIAMSIFAGVQ